MTKFRILEIKEPDKIYYLLQVRKFIFWKTECDGGADDIGIYEYPRRFNTVGEAKDFYIKWHTKPIITIHNVT